MILKAIDLNISTFIALAYNSKIDVRKAISEKIKRDYAELQDKPKKEYCPF